MRLFGKSMSVGNDNDHESILDQALFTIPGTDDKISWADSIEGILVTGATGSGKSSGPGRQIALAMLKSDFGFCVLCAKPDERIRWERLAQETGRENDLVIFNEESAQCFNFLEYELKRHGKGTGEVINLIDTLINLTEQQSNYRGSGRKKEEAYWENGYRRLISRTISFLMLANEEVSIKNIRSVVTQYFDESEIGAYDNLKKIINSKEEIDKDERSEAVKDFEEWKENSYFARILDRVKENAVNLDTDEYDLIIGYWTKEFPRLPDKNRSTFIEYLLGIIEPFVNKGILKEQFSDGLSQELLPENIVSQKKIVVIDFPLKEYGLAGAFASNIYKSCFQACMARRMVESEDNPMPVSLYIDEYQYFMNVSDAKFQTTARSSWVSTVYLTQNINNLYSLGASGQTVYQTKALLGNLNLKFFCSNQDFETNKWASEMLGKHFVNIQTVSRDANSKLSQSKNQQLHYRVAPDFYTTLKTGRKRNNFIVEAIICKAGRVWGKDKENFALVSFNQRS